MCNRTWRAGSYEGLLHELPQGRQKLDGVERLDFGRSRVFCGDPSLEFSTGGDFVLEMHEVYPIVKTI
jgi:hypothetical protein